MGTTPGQRLVVVWLVLTGASTLLYADLVSLPAVGAAGPDRLVGRRGRDARNSGRRPARGCVGTVVGIVVAVFSVLFAVWPEAYWIWV